MISQNGDASRQSVITSPVRLAIRNQRTAIETLFRQFIDDQESIIFVHYFGLKGMWHIGSHSFGCLTDRRICSLQIGWLGHVSYSDGFLEDCNSLEVNQPSLLVLYAVCTIFILSTFGIGVLVLPFLVRLYYRLVKSGLLANIRSGGHVDIFCNRREIVYLNRLVRIFIQEREQRLASVFGISVGGSATIRHAKSVQS